MADILSTLSPLVKKINDAMLDLIQLDEDVVAHISNYSFEGGGKRLRPLLFCLMWKAFDKPLDKPALNTSAAFEFLHMATLLHDDIIDVADLRRGRKAAHLNFGVPEAILAGDYLLAKAANLGVDTGNLQCAKILSDVVSALSLGELFQLQARHNAELSEDDYFKIIFRKTAALMESSCKTAAVLAGVPENMLKAATEYGCKFGLAFQIADDILDYQGNEDKFGKPVGHDLDEGKITLPLIRARESLSGNKRARLCELASKSKISAAEHKEINSLVYLAGGVQSAKEKANELISEAIKALACFPPTSVLNDLKSLATYVTVRDH